MRETKIRTNTKRDISDMNEYNLYHAILKILHHPKQNLD